jgi:hypothetical protein
LLSICVIRLDKGILSSFIDSFLDRPGVRWP